MSGRGKSSGIGITSGSESDIPIKSPKRKKITDTLYSPASQQLVNSTGDFMKKAQNLFLHSSNTSPSKIQETWQKLEIRYKVSDIAIGNLQRAK